MEEIIKKKHKSTVVEVPTEQRREVQLVMFIKKLLTTPRQTSTA